MGNKATTVFTKIDMHGGDTTVCWEWKGGVTGAGRPAFDLGGKKVTPYRLVYELVFGEKIPKNMVVRHKCDNPICCNPHHIELGTHIENMRDMKERNRHGLPAIAVKAIRKLLKAGQKTHEEIAALYGVERSTIGRIARGEAYDAISTEDEGGSAETNVVDEAREE